jgi:hypothetical protein
VSPPLGRYCITNDRFGRLMPRLRGILSQKLPPYTATEMQGFAHWRFREDGKCGAGPKHTAPHGVLFPLGLPFGPAVVACRLTLSDVGDKVLHAEEAL